MKKSAYQDVDWYDRPESYDILLAEDTPTEADFIEAVLEAYAKPGARRLLEPACGSGRLVVEMARRGYDLTGFDLSESMLAYAGKRLSEENLQAELLQASLDEFRLKHRVELAFCLLSSFRYLMTDKSAREHLRRVAASLTKGGIYILGLHLSEYDYGHMQHERWVAQRDRMQVVCNLRSWPVDRRKRLERLRSRITVTDLAQSDQAGACDKFETEWDFKSYDANQLRKLLKQVPEFEHLATHDFTYDIDAPRSLDDEHLDNVLILRKR